MGQVTKRSYKPFRFARKQDERIGPMTLQPGKWGAKVNTETGEVTAVEDGQSRTLGVEKDWFIIEIDGKPYSKDLFTQKKEGTQAYQVFFSAKDQWRRINAIINAEISAKD